MKKPLSRRTLLRGAAGVALGLPLLEAMMPRTARAATASLPRRIIFVFKSNGDQVSRRFDAKSETGFKLGEFLTPLEPYRNECIFMEGISKRFNQLSSSELADNHEQGGSALAPWPSGSGSYPVGGTDRKVGFVLGASADVAIGTRVQKENPSVLYKCLNYRVGDVSNNIWNQASHGGPTGAQNPLAPETDPYSAYARLFDPLFSGTGSAEALRRVAMKKSALDLVLAEANSLRAKLGVADQTRLDRHADALRDIERALQNPGTTSASCHNLTLGAKLDPYDDANHALVGGLFFKIIALAYACDIARVTNFNWSGNTNDRVYANLGMTDGHHTMSHLSDDTAYGNIRKIKKWLWTNSTGLYEALKAVPEGDKTLWDNTLVVHWDELDQGDTHGDTNNLVVFAGGSQLGLRRGRYLDFKGAANNGFADMLVSCFHAMGYTDTTSYGDMRFNSGGPLSGLT